jgi:hypothetical protein
LTSFRRDLHPQDSAHAGRTNAKRRPQAAFSAVSRQRLPRPVGCAAAYSGLHFDAGCLLHGVLLAGKKSAGRAKSLMRKTHSASQIHDESSCS